MLLCHHCDINNTVRERKQHALYLCLLEMNDNV